MNARVVTYVHVKCNYFIIIKRNCPFQFPYFDKKNAERQGEREREVEVPLAKH